MNWTPNQPASDNDIAKLIHTIKFELPEVYLDLLRRYNGGEGEIALPPMWLQLWNIDEVIENNGLDLFMGEFHDYFFFASNGGLESIAMRKLPSGTMEIIMVDMIAGLSSVEVISDDFVMFEKAIGHTYKA